MDDLAQAMSEMTRMFTASVQDRAMAPPPRQTYANAQPTPGGVVQNAPRWNQSEGCMFCSAHDHYVRDCPVVQQYIAQGKIRRNIDGKLVLPDNRGFLPRNLPGGNMRERLDHWWRTEGARGRNSNVVSANFLEGPEECIMAIDVVPRGELTDDESNDVDAQIQAHLQQVLQLQKGKKQKFDGVEIARRFGPPKRNGTLSSLPNASANARPAPPQPSAAPQNISANATGKPGGRAGDTSFLRPQGPMRPTTFPSKPPAEEPKFRYHAPIESSTKTNDLADRALDAQITISTRELLAASPDVRRHVKDAVTTNTGGKGALIQQIHCDFIVIS